MASIRGPSKSFTHRTKRHSANMHVDLPSKSRSNDDEPWEHNFVLRFEENKSGKVTAIRFTPQEVICILDRWKTALDCDDDLKRIMLKQEA